MERRGKRKVGRPNTRQKPIYHRRMKVVTVPRPFDPNDYCVGCQQKIADAVLQELRAKRPMEEHSYHPDCWRKKGRKKNGTPR